MKFWPVVFAIVLLHVPPAHALDVSLEITPEDVQFAGTPVVLQASATRTRGEEVVYQFSYRPVGGTWRVLRDFDVLDRFDWATLEEGEYEVRVRARLRSAGQTARDVDPFRIVSHGTADPIVLPTANPLVALYSAPACSAIAMRVRFRHEQSQFWQLTPFKPCVTGAALNFHVAGMRADANYLVHHQIVTSTSPPQLVDGPLLTFHTGVPTVAFNTVTPAQFNEGASVLDAMVLHAVYGGDSWFPAATDWSGATTWYYPEPMTTLLRPLFGGNMLILVREEVTGRVLREIDLAGNVVRETNSTEVSRQLVAMGHDPIGVFHHEAIRLPNGHTLALASVERILSDVQGPGPVNVLGDMIVDLDENFEVVWAWNAFDWLDPLRMAILGETCISEGPGCPVLFLAPTATDWLHSNSIGYVPEDGNVVISIRHQDWVIKIDYRDGTGSGEVLWRLGEGGDFTLTDNSQNASPWFSHQHDAKMAGGGLLLHDNGNTRVEGPGGSGGNSRGQVFLLDEAAMTARLVINVDLGAYSPALGSAERLTNGNFYFTNGLLGDFDNPSSEVVEVSPDGALKFTMSANAFVYRSFRLRDMYRP